MYYMRAKVPPPLRKLVGKAEIVVSLKTREPAQAVKRVKIESLKADRIIADAEAKMRGQPSGAETSDEELRWMARKAFIELETGSLQHDAKLLPQLDEQEREEIILGHSRRLWDIGGSSSSTPRERQTVGQYHETRH